MAPEGPAGERLSDADRDALAAALGRHFAAGRLDADALDARLEVALAAATREEAAGALADLPADGGAAVPARRRRWGRGRHGEASAAAAGWLPTPERFIDPTSGRVMRVWRSPGSGERHYVPEPER